MAHSIKCVSPVDGSVYAEREATSYDQCVQAFGQAKAAQGDWATLSVAQRCQHLSRAIDHMVTEKPAIAEEIAWQMGRPVTQAPGEIAGLEERARYMISVAEPALSTIEHPANGSFKRAIKKVPHGVVFVIAPWNYPYLTAVNSIIPALAAGNAVVLKHSSQTLLCAERFAQGFAAAGLPDNVFQFLHMQNDDATRLIENGLPNHIVFTGSVEVGKLIQRASAGAFCGVDLELGGKDPAYVRADANLDFSAEQLVDGAFFNSGQSCCGIERIYAHESVFDEFVDRAVSLAEKYQLGNPLDASTNLGPLVKTSAAEFVRDQIAEAVDSGARTLVNESAFAASQPDSAYLAPQILIDVDHSMRLMHEENFGPVVGIMKVRSDQQAIDLMNDSHYGLTASLWTEDLNTAEQLADQIHTGTCFANRCDYLDPSLAWTGVKDTGRGCSLSRLAYDRLTRPQSFNFRSAG